MKKELTFYDQAVLISYLGITCCKAVQTKSQQCAVTIKTLQYLRDLLHIEIRRQMVLRRREEGQ